MDARGSSRTTTSITRCSWHTVQSAASRTVSSTCDDGRNIGRSSRPMSSKTEVADPAAGHDLYGGEIARDRRDIDTILVLTIVALLVRLPGLGSGLWADEIWAVMESIRTPFPHSLADFPGDNKHPLYALL